jgi:hypothetical protein
MDALLAVTGVEAGPETDAQGAGEHEDAHHEQEHERDWLAVLTELEHEADRAEELLDLAPRADEPPAATTWWEAPRGLGPLPAALAGRATALVERQQDLQRRTQESLVERRRSLRAGDALRTRPAATPVYLDAEA